VRLRCGTGPAVRAGSNVVYVDGGRGQGQGNNVSSATLTIIGILAAVILGTAVLTGGLLVKKWLAKHIYYPSGVTVTAEKPLIYDKIDNLGLGGPGAPGGLGASGLQTTYQTTALSTFRPETASSSLDSSCSALLCSHSQTHHQGEKHCSSMQSQLSSVQDPARRVLNTYSSLPRPGRLVGWRYAETQEVTNSTILARRTEAGPEYANLIPWTPQPARARVEPPPPPPPAVHYATLGRAPHTNRLVTASKMRERNSDSIPDILQTLAGPSHHHNHSNQANVIVNELSDIEMEADLVDLNSPEPSHKVTQ